MPATTAPGLEADILAPLWLEPEQSSQVFEIGTGILDLVGASAVPIGSPADFKPQHCAILQKVLSYHAYICKAGYYQSCICQLSSASN